MERSVLHDAHNKIKLVHVCSKPNIGSVQIMKLCKHFDKYGLNVKLMTKLKTILILFLHKALVRDF